MNDKLPKPRPKLDEKMTQKIELTVKQARALCLIAPKNDARYYMNGVWVDFTKQRLVATDGHRLLQTPAKSNDSGNCIVPRELLDTIAKGGKADDGLEIAYDNDTETVTLLRQNGMSVSGDVIDGTFPNVDRVIPAFVSNDVAQYNPDYLAQCQRAIRLCEDSNNLNCHMAHNGNSPGIMSAAGFETFAVIMPLRAEAPADWVRTIEPEKETAAA